MRTTNAERSKAKREIRKLVRLGLSKKEASKITGISYATAILYTSDMKTPKGDPRISGITLKILKELVSTGFYFPNRNLRATYVYRILKKNFPVRRIKTHGMVVYVMEGSERLAMEEMMNKLNLKSVSWQKLELIRKVFGVKSLKNDNKFRGRFVA